VVRWQSKSETELEDHFESNTNQTQIFQHLSRVNGWGDFLTNSNVSTLFNFSKDVINEFKDIFLQTVQVGKITGKILAHYLSEHSDTF
jgi:hypothetical protein